MTSRLGLAKPFTAKVQQSVLAFPLVEAGVMDYSFVAGSGLKLVKDTWSRA